MNANPLNAAPGHAEVPPETIDPASMVGVRRPITQATMADYRKIARRLEEYSSRIRSSGPEDRHTPSPLEIVTDLISRRPQWKQATWSNYRAAMIWDLAPMRASHPQYEQAWQMLKAISLEPMPGEKRGARRWIPQVDYHALLQELLPSARPSAWRQRAAFWVEATLASGLRPGEWLRAHWLDDTREQLEVFSSKQKLDNPLGFDALRAPEDKPLEGSEPTPLVRLVRIAPADRAQVQTHMSLIAEAMRADGIDDSTDEQARTDWFTRYYNAARLALHNANKRAFKGKKHYSLYTLRSQWFANKKAESIANGGILDDVRREGGHVPGSITTMNNYGYARVAFGAKARRESRQKHCQQARPCSESLMC